MIGRRAFLCLIGLAPVAAPAVIAAASETIAPRLTLDIMEERRIEAINKIVNPPMVVRTSFPTGSWRQINSDGDRNVLLRLYDDAELDAKL